ncbi:rod shape-determining protein RodA [Paroceanicella profunda]|uniref:Peptidoglycan glycosyltransferase MrdB n=1 Tax=Paroceanicella profunda TaxID=2579971 RepID=A0A5B8FW05_9RHOB|nr:rod shape-determining protein RodA [Paroceanicella profunda]QDL90679.1 rod shape-determining protein RodA [Paroceanicella profunda]
MSFVPPPGSRIPSGPAKILYFHWGIAVLLAAVSCVGFLMLFSVADGSLEPWSQRQMMRFGAGFALMLVVAMINIRFWRSLAIPSYLGSLALLVAVEFIGEVGMGAQRWIDLGFFQLQPSEVMKIALVLVLARYYDWLDPEKVSRPLWVIPPVILTLLPMGLVLMQPDLGTALLLGIGAAVVMFLAGVSLWYFGTAALAACAVVFTVMTSQGTDWQLLKDYQFRRISTFLDPSSDPLGAGYHITQSTIAMGSGGLTGRGFMQGTQSRLNFLPEKHTDFIFTTLSEEFGFVGSISLLGLYTLIIALGTLSALTNRDRFGSLVTGGITATFFLYFAINMAMVMGLAPVVGVPLPLVSYGGSAMLVLMGAFGLLQSAHVHKPR